MLDTLPAYEVKDNKTTNNPMEAQIVAEVQFCFVYFSWQINHLFYLLFFFCLYNI